MSVVVLDQEVVRLKDNKIMTVFIPDSSIGAFSSWEYLVENGYDGTKLVDKSTVDLNPTRFVPHVEGKIVNYEFFLIEEAKKIAKLDFNYEEDAEMTLADALNVLIIEALPHDTEYDMSELYDFINSKLK